MTPTNGQLKRSARSQLNGSWRNHIGISASLLLLELIGWNLSGLYTGTTTMSLIFGLAVTFILNVFLGLFYDGAGLYFLHLARGEAASFRDLAAAYRQQADRFIIISLIRTGVLTAIELPMLLMRSLPAALITMALLGIAGIYLLLSIAPAPFLLFDRPEMSAPDAISLSLRLVKGNRRRLFLLELSFLPWVLLSAAALGVGTLWVIPYTLASFANFYLSLPFEEEAGRTAVPGH